jgi:mRNA-degrading endonuclease RelE of RelBE toxin-antitoxin system
MPARVTLIFSPSFRRDLEGLPPRAHDEVLEALKQLEVSPKGPSPKIKKLKGKGVASGVWKSGPTGCATT